MVLNDTLSLLVRRTSVDDNLDTTETTSWTLIGKCAIVKNTKGQTVRGEDGKSYEYAYDVYMRRPKTLLPKKGDLIHLRKKDGTIDLDFTVADSVTLKNWLRIWV